MDSSEFHRLLFVYDALMSGKARRGFLSREKARSICSAWTQGQLFALGDVPALTIHSFPNTLGADIPVTTDASQRHRVWDDAPVDGELFEIFDPENFFPTLDLIKGYWPDQPERSLFVRKLIPVQTQAGETMAWAYLLNLPVNGLPRFGAEESDPL